jgi:hypothetical protein
LSPPASTATRQDTVSGIPCLPRSTEVVYKIECSAANGICRPFTNWFARSIDEAPLRPVTPTKHLRLAQRSDLPLAITRLSERAREANRRRDDAVAVGVRVFGDLQFVDDILQLPRRDHASCPTSPYEQAGQPDAE